jgi:hypothetical protein
LNNGLSHPDQLRNCVAAGKALTGCRHVLRSRREEPGEGLRIFPVPGLDKPVRDSKEIGVRMGGVVCGGIWHRVAPPMMCDDYHSSRGRP